MPTVNMHEAKTQLSRLVKAALDGEEVVIARAGKPAVRLVPVPEPLPKRQLGILRGKV
jgi:prevent-host-death family protein